MKTSFWHLLFATDELARLERDFSRRFKKSAFQKKPTSWKLQQFYGNRQTRTLLFYRLARACRIPFLKNLLERGYQRASHQTGIEFHTPDLGGGLILPHWGRIILNARSIGTDLYVFHNVTVGNDYASGIPTLGNNVFIGVNSVILGQISIGDNVVIGACSFVNQDVPANSLVAGNSAKVIKTISPDFISDMIGY